MRTPVRLPPMGPSVERAVVVRWHRSVGDQVAAGDPLCEIDSDKVVSELEAPAGGVLTEILVAEGTVVEVGETVAVLAGDPAEALAGTHPPPEEPRRAVPPEDGDGGDVRGGAVPDGPAADPFGTPRPAWFDTAGLAAAAVSTPRADGAPLTSPLARRAAVRLGVDLATVRGSGQGGRIRREDIEVAARSTPHVAGVPAGRSAPAPRPGLEKEPAATAGTGLPRGYEDEPHSKVPHTAVRRAIAERMVASLRTAAHIAAEVDVDLWSVTEARRALNARRASQGRPVLSFLPWVVRATCIALQEHPDLNASWSDDALVRWQHVNLAIAVDTPAGLMVPVIRRCERLTVEAIGDAILDLATRARTRQLVASEVAGATFTVTNPGALGAGNARAIINVPQVAILGTGAISKRVVVLDGDVMAIRPVMPLALTFDHRALDGGEPTRCVVRIRKLLEAWDEHQG